MENTKEYRNHFRVCKEALIEKIISAKDDFEKDAQCTLLDIDLQFMEKKSHFDDHKTSIIYAIKLKTDLE